MKTYDFGSGRTDPASFPVAELAAAAQQGIEEVGTDFVNYPGELGHLGLREIMAMRETKREGIEVSPDHLTLTNGSFQGVTMVAEALMERPGEIIVTEELTYSGTIGAYKRMGAQLVGVPIDDDGMRIDALDRTLGELARRGTPPRFVYTLATYQNPTGSVMPRPRRLELLEVARKHRVVVVEDNCYGDVHFEGPVQPALYALDDSPDVVYLCSLSKIFGPGVRLGYVLARPPMMERLLDRRYDGGNSLLAAAVCAAYFRDRLWDHIEFRNALLKEKRDAVFAAFEKYGDGLCSWTRPVGGLFIWVGFPPVANRQVLREQLAERQVLHAPGSSFHVHGQDVPFLRLAFGFIDRDDVEEGVRLLVECVRAAVADSAAIAASESESVTMASVV